MNLPLTVLAQTALKVTVGWTPPTGVSGYRFFRDGQPVSTSWDPAKAQASFSIPDSNPHTFAVVAVAASASGSVTVNQPAPPPSNVLFTQAYDAASATKLATDGNIVAPHGYSVTFPNKDTCRFEVRAGDQYSTWSGERAQLQLPGIQGREGDRWHWRFAFTLDPGFQFATGFYNVLWEHHHTGLSGSPPCTLQLKGNRLVWRQVKSSDPGQANYWTETDLAAAVPGARADVEVDCLLSTDPAKARTSVTVNGLAKTISGPNLLAGMNVYVEWGLYRAPSPITQIVTFSPVDRLA